MNSLLLILLSAGLAVLVSSFGEWCLHRFVLHRPFPMLRELFEMHAKHHRAVRAGASYHCVKPEASNTLKSPRWVAFLALSLYLLPATLLTILFERWEFLAGTVPVATLFIAATSYVHRAIHQPKGRSIESKDWFRRLNARHLLHHRGLCVNFNLVFPLADWLMGTLQDRATLRFKQVESVLVPDVQPKGAQVWPRLVAELEEFERLNAEKAKNEQPAATTQLSA